MASIYDNLPDDPKFSFLILENHFRNLFNNKVSSTSTEYFYNNACEEYINLTITALQELELENDILFSIDTNKDWRYNVKSLMNLVDSYRVRINIRTKFVPKTYSIAIESSEKTKIHHYLDNIKTIVENWKIEDKKKDSIYKKINALSLEVDLKRTRLEIFCDAVLTITGTAKKAAEDLEPIRKWLDPLERYFEEQRIEQDLERIAYSEPKQLELKETA